MSKQISIINVPITDLKAAAYNPRKHSPEQLEQLKTSIAKFGLIDPLIVNGAPKRKNVVIGGHMRLKAAQELGHTEVAVVYVNIPDLEKEKELNLRLNRNTGEWDLDLLKEFQTEFLLDIGFSDTDLSDIWNDVLEIEEDEFDEEQQIEAAKDTDIKLGDRFRLGKHFLVCGDSRDLGVVQKLVGDAKIDAVYCDPNFNIGLSYQTGLGGAKRYGDELDDEKPDAEYREDIRRAMANAVAVSANDSHHFWYHDPRYTGMFQSLFAEVGIKYRRTALWIKNGINVTPQIAFSRMYESCLYGTRGKPYLSPRHTKFAEILNKDIGIGNATLDDITDMIDIWLAKRDAGSEYAHCAQKPLSLHEKPLNRCTKIGQSVLDLYGGSGSTLLACEQMKRKAFLIERSPIFCQVIINRYETFSKDKAIKLD